MGVSHGLLKRFDTVKLGVIVCFHIENFYPVPEIFGNKKENALVFQKKWEQYMGRNKLVFTRQVEGRKLLLKARLFHVHNAFKEVSKEVVVWR